MNDTSAIKMVNGQELGSPANWDSGGLSLYATKHSPTCPWTSSSKKLLAHIPY